jgi:mono/diheme cytochrome c family protein
VKLAFCLVVQVALVAACEKKQPAAYDGPSLFAANCARCHGANGKPDAMLVARMGVKDLTAPDVRAKMTPELVEHQIRKGSKNGLMPAFEGGLIDEYIKAIAEYVAGPTFGKQ